MRKLALILLLPLSACSLENSGLEQQGNLPVAAAAGGVLGAGLGAIVGNQVGNPGTGLVVGGLAGAGAGAMIGQALDGQEDRYRAQDERIARQDQTLRAQRAELEEYQRQQHDTARMLKNNYNNQSSSLARESKPMARLDERSQYLNREIKEREIKLPEAEVVQPPQSAARSSILEDESRRSASIHESAIPAAGPAAIVGSRNGAIGSGVSSSQTGRLAGADSANQSDDCDQANQEVASAKRSKELSERLYHYRRALRLCPSRAEFHSQLAETYRALGRKKDAEFEYKEALGVDPGYQPAISGLKNLQSEQ